MPLPFPPSFSISIHAPAKGATNNLMDKLRKLAISIHAPAKGATQKTYCTGLTYTEFQSTLPRRERHNSRRRFKRFNFISIHAPAKGATIFPFLTKQKGYEFQSTLPRRERLFLACLFSYLLIFQSTLPRRERRHG